MKAFPGNKYFHTSCSPAKMVKYFLSSLISLTVCKKSSAVPCALASCTERFSFPCPEWPPLLLLLQTSFNLSEFEVSTRIPTRPPPLLFNFRMNLTLHSSLDLWSEGNRSKAFEGEPLALWRSHETCSKQERLKTRLRVEANSHSLTGGEGSIKQVAGSGA